MKYRSLKPRPPKVTKNSRIVGKIDSTDKIILGARRTRKDPICVLKEIDRVVIPTGIAIWVNVYFAARKVHRNGERVGGIILILRKYCWWVSKQVPGTGFWKLKQSYNINRVVEAKAIYDLIRVYFPEVLDT